MKDYKKITFFKDGILNTDKPEYISVRDALDMIGSNTYRDQIKTLRGMDPDKYKKAKRDLSYFVFSAVCDARRSDKVRELTGFINGDIDGLESTEKAVELRDKLSKDKHIFAAWVPVKFHVKIF